MGTPERVWPINTLACYRASIEPNEKLACCNLMMNDGLIEPMEGDTAYIPMVFATCLVSTVATVRGLLHHFHHTPMMQ